MNRMLWTLLAFVALLAASIMPGFANVSSGSPPDTATLSQPTLPDLSGKLVNIKTLEGKLLVINIWANWCPVCHHEAPGFVRLHNRLGARVRFVGIALDSRASAEAFVHEEHIDYLTLLAGKHPGKILSIVGDPQKMLPFTLIVGPDGKVLERHLGYYPIAQLEKTITQALRAGR